MEIRRLGVDDIPECMKLITDRGWSWTPAQWEMMLALGPGFGAFDGAALLGTALTTPYPEMQAISGVLVASWAGRRGIGTRLMASTLDISPSVLYATAMGEPLYARLGFHSVGETTDFHGVFTGAAPGVTREATPADTATLAELDREVSGYTRPALWERLLDPSTPYAVLMSDSGVIATRPNPEGVTIGPLIAPSASAACELIADLASGSGRVRVDTDNAEVGAFLLGQGFEQRTGGCKLMVRGAADVPGDRSRYFAPASHALG
ncbi:GNAT family N-acetyltransferase [Lentzea sp. NPDC092896]|uniref:GNAT family N-acetyltransferase n=1 Tax=Lentzea sp. NPDC092896 TaxID=3364127 RepID=UPI003820CB42